MDAQAAADLELSSGASVMAIGGFLGSDPFPSLGQFQRYVAAAQVRYFIAGRGESAIANWVRQNFTPTMVGDQTVYDLSKPRAGP